MIKYIEQGISESLIVPVDIEVFLIGFDGDGGYAYKQDASQLLSLLNAGASRACPHSLESGEELGVCFQMNFQVLGADALGPEAGALLGRIEEHLRHNMKDIAQPWMLQGDAFGGQGQGGDRTVEYSVDAAGLEPLFDAFMEYAYGRGEKNEKGHSWHNQNPIFIINPSKVRANPVGAPEAASHHVPDFLAQWRSHTFSPADLDKEEAGLVYRYSYNGLGEATTWLSSRNYVVVDVAAGPTSYGPAASSEGAVGAGALPALRDVYRAIMRDLNASGPSISAQDHAQARHTPLCPLFLPCPTFQCAPCAVVARHAQKALFEGALASAVAAGARSLFVPDMATEHIEYAKNILIPVVLLTDYELTDDDYEKHMTQEDFMHINLTHIEAAVARLIDQQQEAVVVSAHHPLSRHKAIAAALWKARRLRAEPALEHEAGKASRVGHHTVSHTAVDPESLLEEIALAADTLTHGLVGAAHAMSKEGAHPLEQLRHDGTRVVPVFVISLMKAPEDVMFSNKEMVAASHDAVLVLQPRNSAQWGGERDDVSTGHVANGRRITADGHDVTHHVVAGLAQALAGVLPPYSRPRAHAGPALQDWRWAVGATPFGPYSNYSDVSELMQNAARRNLLLSHVSAALRATQHRLDALDDFVADNFESPWAAAGVGPGALEGRKHFLDTVASTRHGFQTAITPDSVADLEGRMGVLTQHLEALASDLYSHDFASADETIRTAMLPAAARLCEGLDATLEEARTVMACCTARHGSTLGRAAALLAAAAVAFAVVLAAAVLAEVVVLRRRRLSHALMLPTYGMSQYSRPASRQHSWQA
ncbi:hypothetical protein MNEG_1669 [Monoraphidium neglectum]|uniref:DUF7906 domain-containing protein n=1 Tax=Monoraphidium neglectum TaxID=145388 RepID=A0A0D2K7U3_9CHLO|nr:hypothetical protein MNEG_1669 [Monoraphidium neglectum]KIZ06288.1 hypothetical protein MNEG_1669 [Monoraphidium neglectum]|eukprot:XP_013905307.1 hypothetical protein MNEG_1669 [Monoraphidium neglectum]